MQKLKIEQDFAEKAKLVQLELEREREKAKSEKEKYETEKAKLEHERKKLEQLQMEIWEREERNSTPINISKHSSISNNSLNASNTDKSLNTDRDLNETSAVVHQSMSTASEPITVSHDLVTDNMAATVLGASNSEQYGLKLHENIHGLQQAPTLTNSELLEREKQLLLQQEKLDAMQAQLNGKMSGNHMALDSNASTEIRQFLTEKDKIEQQRLLLEKAKFSAESKER